MTDRARLAAHLRLFKDLGVTGISRDPAWRERQAIGGGNAGAAVDPEALTADAAGDESSVDIGQAAAAGEALVPEAVPAGPDAAVSVRAAASDAPDATDAGVMSPDEAAFAALPFAPPDAGLAALRAHIGACMRCQLSGMGRKQVVFGVGDPNAKLMFVGEGPGADEDQQGEPFVGQAGQLLTKIIAAIDFARGDVYIANVVKCRPPGNRNPEPVEVETCSPFLLRQIEIIRPKVIVALGAFAAQTLLQTKVPISRLRGHVHDFRPGTKVIPTFHPSFLLRNRNNRDLYRDVWEDVKKARALLADP